MKVREVRPYSGPVDPDGRVPVYDITAQPNLVYSVHGVAVANSKRVSMLDTNALLSHGALETLKDATLVRGQRNDQYLMQFMQGYTPQEPSVPFVYSKFVDTLKASGINVVKSGPVTNIMALTNRDIEKLAGNREIRNGDTVNFDKGLKPIPGGLFDPQLTGSHAGGQWSFIKLPEPMPSPIMEEPIRRVLDLTQKQFEAVLSGQEKLKDFGTGPKAIQEALKTMDVDTEISNAKSLLKEGNASQQDQALRKLKFLQGAKTNDIHPSDWMLDKVPVIPPKFRPVSMLGGSGIPMVSDVNYLYKEVLSASKNLEDMRNEVGDDGLGPERLALYHSFKAVTGLGDPTHPKLQEKGVKGLLKDVFGSSPKFGSVQRKLIATAVNNVGRATVVPNPDYDMDTIGLPEEQAFKVYTPKLARRLRRMGMPLSVALQEIADRTDRARTQLIEEMKVSPVIANRAPVLHKFGIMAFTPVLVSGHALQMPPMVAQGFNADYDGDQQYNYVFVAISNNFNAEYSQTVNLNYNFAVKHLKGVHSVASRFKTMLPVAHGSDVCYVHLEDFPHGKYLRTTEGQFGLIDWFEVPEGVRVLAYNEKRKLEWRQVSVWSVHRDCKVQIVNLQSGRQIFTDDDPRAVFGIPMGKLKLERTTPTDAVARKFLVPRVAHTEGVTVTGEIYEELSGRHYDTDGDGLRLNRLKDSIPLNADLGYLIGAAAGDGWATANEKDFVLASITPEIDEKIDAIITNLFENEAPNRATVVGERSHGESIRHTWTSICLNKLIASCVGQKSRCKRLPSWLLATPKEFREGVFAGLMDTDGSIAQVKAAVKTKPQLMANFFSTSLRLCQEMLWLGHSLGIRGRITSTKTPAGLPAWLTSWSNYDIKKWNGLHMEHPNKLKALREIEEQENGIRVRNDAVPISEDLATHLMQKMRSLNNGRPKGFASAYALLSKAKKIGTISRTTAKFIKDKLVPKSVIFEHKDGKRWWSFVKDTTVVWDTVESFEDTDQTLTGYDLTVPGAETFADVNGVILSNTMQFHVPMTSKAVEEAYERLLPSKNLISPSDFQSAVHAPREEDFLSGLYLATRDKPTKERPRVFRSKEDAIKAYERGEIRVTTPVEILES